MPTTAVTSLKARIPPALFFQGRIFSGERRPPLAFKDVTLPIEMLLAREAEIKGLLWQLFPARVAKAKWVAMSMVLLRLGVYYKRCFPTARYVAEVHFPAGQGASRRMFWRMVAWLEGQKLLRRSPGVRENLSYASNDYDITGLANLLHKLLSRRRDGYSQYEVECVGYALWVKAKGFWYRLEEWLGLLSPPAPKGHPPWKEKSPWW